MTLHSLKISEEVSANSEVVVATSALYGDVRIIKFTASAAHIPNAALLLVFDYGGASESIIWTIKGTSEAPGFPRIAASGETVSLIASNDTGSPLFLSGLVNIEVV